MAIHNEQSRSDVGFDEQPRSTSSGSDMRNRQESVSESDIAQRAYRRYEVRGYEDGHDLEDWLEAEREAREQGSRVGGGSE
jgi:hypothetical protein